MNKTQTQTTTAGIGSPKKKNEPLTHPCNHMKHDKKMLAALQPFTATDNSRYPINGVCHCIRDKTQH